MIEKVRAYKYNENKESFGHNHNKTINTKSLNNFPGLSNNLAQAASSLKHQANLNQSLKAVKVEKSPRVRFADLDDEV